MMKLKTIGFAALTIATVGCFAPQVHAEPTSEPVGDAITRALFKESGDIYHNASIGRQATLLFGLSYPEHEYLNDAQAVGKIYKDAIRQRVNSVVTTQDLPNPFTSSLLTNPPQVGSVKN
jgi:hypothetical protein